MPFFLIRNVAAEEPDPSAVSPLQGGDGADDNFGADDGFDTGFGDAARTSSGGGPGGGSGGGSGDRRPGDGSKRGPKKDPRHAADNGFGGAASGAVGGGSERAPLRAVGGAASGAANAASGAKGSPSTLVTGSGGGKGKAAANDSTASAPNPALTVLQSPPRTWSNTLQNWFFRTQTFARKCAVNISVKAAKAKASPSGPTPSDEVCLHYVQNMKHSGVVFFKLSEDNCKHIIRWLLEEVVEEGMPTSFYGGEVFQASAKDFVDKTLSILNVARYVQQRMCLEENRIRVRTAKQWFSFADVVLYRMIRCSSFDNEGAITALRKSEHFCCHKYVLRYAINTCETIFGRFYSLHRRYTNASFTNEAETMTFIVQYADPDLKTFDPERRKCLFIREPLRYPETYRVYSKGTNEAYKAERYRVQAEDVLACMRNESSGAATGLQQISFNFFHVSHVPGQPLKHIISCPYFQAGDKRKGSITTLRMQDDNVKPALDGGLAENKDPDLLRRRGSEHYKRQFDKVALRTLFESPERGTCVVHERVYVEDVLIEPKTGCYFIGLFNNGFLLRVQIEPQTNYLDALRGVIDDFLRAANQHLSDDAAPITVLFSTYAKLLAERRVAVDLTPPLLGIRINAPLPAETANAIVLASSPFMDTVPDADRLNHVLSKFLVMLQSEDFIAHMDSLA
jgi:hypothetical protein